MPLLSPLLEVQELDLTSDRLAEQRRTLPERAALARCRAHAEALDGAHAALVARRTHLTRSEHELAGEVAETARHAREVEDRLYSGSVRATKELSALQEDVRQIRVAQAGLEEREMALLEEIDAVEQEIEANRADRSASEAEAAKVASALAEAEARIEAELAEVAGRRARAIAGLPDAVVAEYERLRGRERLGGRAAVALVDGGCGGCRVKLPVLEYNTMRAQPEDALLSCVRCGRILIR